MPREIHPAEAECTVHQLCAETASGGSVLIADFTGTFFCDSAGLRHLLVAQDRAGAHGRELRVAVLPDGAIRHLLAITGLDQLLPVYESLEQARTAPAA